jgi:hypothetical protein
VRGALQAALRFFEGTPWSDATIVVNQDDRTFDIIAADGTKATFSELALIRVPHSDAAKMILRHIEDVAARAGHFLIHLHVRRGKGLTRTPLCDAGLHHTRQALDIDEVTCRSCLAAVGDYAVALAAGRAR